MLTSLLDPPMRQASASAAERLRLISAAVRVSLSWFGVRKTLTPEQKSQAAESFGAEGNFLSASKKLLNTSHPAYKEVTAVRGRVIKYWKSNTLPFPEPGIRLIAQSEVEPFNAQIVTFQGELADKVLQLDEHYGELRAAARRRLGSLFNSQDYPASLRGLFSLACDYPNAEPPDYLLQLNPGLYQQEQSRVAARFDQAVQLTEQAFIGEMAQIVSHLTERLTGDETGDAKIFRDSAINNLVDFFERFRRLNVRSNEQLDDLVSQAQRLVQGLKPQELRDNAGLRQHVATQFSSVQAQLDGMLVDRPRRRIIRNRAEVS